MFNKEIKRRLKRLEKEIFLKDVKCDTGSKKNDKNISRKRKRRK